MKYGNMLSFEDKIWIKPARI